MRLADLREPLVGGRDLDLGNVVLLGEFAQLAFEAVQVCGYFLRAGSFGVRGLRVRGEVGGDGGAK